MSWTDRPVMTGNINFLDLRMRKATMQVNFLLGGGVTEVTARAALASIADALQAQSNARITRTILRMGSDSATYPPNPTPGAYKSIVDRIITKLQPLLPATPVKILLPMPLATDLLADGITVNPADANIGPLLTWFASHAVDFAGNLLIDYLSGTRDEAKPRKLAAGVKMIE